VPASAWKELRVEELIAKKRYSISMGPFGSRITKDNFVSSGVPVIRGVNLSQGRFYPEGFVFLTEDKADELISSNAYPDDLVFTHRGTLGQVGIIPRGLYPRYVASQSQMKVTFDASIVSPMFMFYYFCSMGKTELLKHVSGSGVPAIASPLTTLRNLRVRIPSLPIQQKIAAILSTYDDLIENNLRRIKILEEMAKYIYREWFVKFRFPGHQKVKMVDSPLGNIPEGWKVGTVRDLVEEQKERNTRGITGPVLTVKNTKKFLLSEEYFSKRVFSKSLKNYKEVKRGNFAYNPARINIGSIAFQEDFEVGLVSPMYVVFSAKDAFVGERFLWMLIQQEEAFRQIIQLCSGTVRQIFKISDFALVKVVIPPKELQIKFEGTIAPIQSQVKCLSAAIENLHQARDLLLPKLVSGELDVSELDISIPEANE
jgi:type I restriction enzyme S subunit